jgi:hypothetical protein
MGYIKPGVGVAILTETVQKEISGLTKDDILIFWGETNDIAVNNYTCNQANTQVPDKISIPRLYSWKFLVGMI